MNNNVFSAQELNAVAAARRKQQLDSQIRTFPCALASSKGQPLKDDPPEEQLLGEIPQPRGANPVGKALGEGAYAFSSASSH